MSTLTDYFAELQLLWHRNKLLWRERKNMKKNWKDYSYTTTETATPADAYDKADLDRIDVLLADYVITDFRPPSSGELFAGDVRLAPTIRPYSLQGPRFILREKDWRDSTYTNTTSCKGVVLTPADYYPDSVLQEGIPDGLTFAGFRPPSIGEHYLSSTGKIQVAGTNRSTPSIVLRNNDWRDVKVKVPNSPEFQAAKLGFPPYLYISPRDVYPEEVLDRGIPDGYEFDRFAIPTWSDRYFLSYSGFTDLLNSDHFKYFHSDINPEDGLRVILRKKKAEKPKRRVVTLRETGEVRPLRKGEFGICLNSKALLPGPTNRELPVYTATETWEDAD